MAKVRGKSVKISREENEMDTNVVVNEVSAFATRLLEQRLVLTKYFVDTVLSEINEQSLIEKLSKLNVVLNFRNFY